MTTTPILAPIAGTTYKDVAPKHNKNFADVTFGLTVPTKICTHCVRSFPATRQYFYADSRLKDGLYRRCKSCHSALVNYSVGTEKRHWYNMIARCHYPSARNYRWYGAKGIVVCERWRKSFKAFMEDMGERPGPSYTLGRIGDRGNYEPGNVAWITWKEQHATRIANRRKNMSSAPRYRCGRLKIPQNKQARSVPHAYEHVPNQAFDEPVRSGN